MQIHLDTQATSTAELTALIALCASLGGRLPDHATPATWVNEREPLPSKTIGNMVVKLTADTSELDEMIDRTRAEIQEPAEDDVPLPPEASGNASAPVASRPEPAATDEIVELDADGIPWDARIHAGTKSQTKGKTWTKLRNVDEVLYGKVHAELQEQYAVGGNGEEVPAPPATSAESAPTDDTDVPPPPAPDASGGFKEFAELVAAVAPFNIPYVKLAELARMVSDKKAEKFPDLRTMPEFWDDFYALAQSEG